MFFPAIRSLLLFAIFAFGGSIYVDASAKGGVVRDARLGPVAIDSIPVDKNYQVRSGTYTPSGKVLVSYFSPGQNNPRLINLAVMDDNGENFRPFFSRVIPDREKDNGIRFMVFADNRRIFLGDFIIECAPDIDSCEKSVLLPVEYPPEVAGGDHIAHRWSEIIVAPDNQHIAWTTLLANYSAVVFTGKLHRQDNGYTITKTRIISTTEAFTPDKEHPESVIPARVRGGEVKQFIQGGTALSLVGGKFRDTADSVVQDLLSGEITAITDTPGYNETTIFSPDETLGIIMSPRFSSATDLAVLGLMPRPYPVSLNMGLNMLAYTYSVVGVRRARSGNIGPVLVDIEASKNAPGYLGVNLNTEDEWVFRSPMSWHPGGSKVMWPEGRRGPRSRSGTDVRLQVAHLLDHEPGPAVAAKVTPDDIPYASTDMSVIESLYRREADTAVRVRGRHSGYIEFSRSAGGQIEKHYVDFSDDGESVYTGNETTTLDPAGFSVYTANVVLSGPSPGAMNLKMTFGPLRAELPARLMFDKDEAGKPLSHGFAEYAGQRLTVERLSR